MFDLIIWNSHHQVALWIHPIWTNMVRRTKGWNVVTPSTWMPTSTHGCTPCGSHTPSRTPLPTPWRATQVLWLQSGNTFRYICTNGWKRRQRQCSGCVSLSAARWECLLQRNALENIPWKKISDFPMNIIEKKVSQKISTRPLSPYDKFLC